MILKHKKIIKITDIADVISEKTLIPVYEIAGVNKKYINNLSKHLNKKIIGQDEAIETLINSTKKIKCGFKDDNKPISFLFVGPTGVGKTKLALDYGKYMFGNNVVRLDLSEYRDSTSINKFLGSSPGYVGYDDGNNKLEEIRKCPHSLILLDEIEKAHPSILNLFLQILDDGKITDNKGNVVYFNNDIIIMTSNIGYGKNELGFVENECKDDSKVKEFLSIELLNRIQNVIYFNKMNYNSIYTIVKKKIRDVKKHFREKGINVHINNGIIEKIINDSKYLEYGVRKVDKAIEDNINNIIIDNILDGHNEIFV